jgi:hypothetical protein
MPLPASSQLVIQSTESQPLENSVDSSTPEEKQEESDDDDDALIELVDVTVVDDEKSINESTDDDEVQPKQLSVFNSTPAERKAALHAAKKVAESKKRKLAVKEKARKKKIDEETVAAEKAILAACSATKEVIQDEKDLVILSDAPKRKTAWYWSHFKQGEVSMTEALTKYASEDQFPTGLTKILDKKGEGDLWLCTMCLDKTDVALIDCFRSCRKNGSNLNNHLTSNVHNLKESDEIKATAVACTDGTTKKLKTQSTLRFSKIERSKRNNDDDQHLSEFQCAIEEFINDEGLPDNTCEKDSFRKIIKLAVKNATSLQKQSNYGNIGRVKYSSVKESSFDKMILQLKIASQK